MLHAAAGDCVTVKLKNERVAPATGPAPRVSFHVSEVDRTERSSGVNAGFNPEQTVAIGEERTYKFNVDSADIGSAVIGDMGDPNATARGTLRRAGRRPRRARRSATRRRACPVTSASAWTSTSAARATAISP